MSRVVREALVSAAGAGLGARHQRQIVGCAKEKHTEAHEQDEVDDEPVDDVVEHAGECDGPSQARANGHIWTQFDLKIIVPKPVSRVSILPGKDAHDVAYFAAVPTSQYKSSS